jgi:hypothetical protein
VRLGLLGTFVHDTIWTLEDQRAGRPFVGWGGLAYALAAASAGCAAGVTLVPLARVGADLEEGARAFAAALPGVDAAAGWCVVPEPNNRVELRYADAEHRGERLSGGVGPWSWEALAPRLAGIDALYVNFLSGFEMELPVAEALRRGFDGPIYADLHSLLLGCPGAGVRPPRILPDWERWVRCFDAVQVNERELGLLLGGGAGAGGGGGVEAGAARVAEAGPARVLVTLGAAGAAFARRSRVPDDPRGWPGRPAGGAVRTGRVAAPAAVEGGDPTGAGDVWGSTLFLALLGGASLEAAISVAHARAVRKLSFRGTEGLARHLSDAS